MKSCTILDNPTLLNECFHTPFLNLTILFSHMVRLIREGGVAKTATHTQTTKMEMKK